MAPTPTPVVVAVDGTDLSSGAIAYAVEEARRHGVGLRVVHVSPTYLPLVPPGPVVPMTTSQPPLLEEQSQQVLDAVCAEVAAAAPDVPLEPVLCRGAVTASILHAATGARVLVVGQETRTGLDRWAAGATTVKVAARAACPVVAVPVLWRPGPPRHRLVVGVRSAAEGPDLLAQAFALAEERADTLVVLHAWRLPDPYLDGMEARAHASEWTAKGEALLEEVLAAPRASHPGVVVETRVVHREPTTALVEAGGEADLLLLARRARERGHLTRLGATARAVLRRVPCPVVVLPAHAPRDA